MYTTCSNYFKPFWYRVSSDDDDGDLDDIPLMIDESTFDMDDENDSLVKPKRY
jgi:hypothetical protein